jgi:hypothetical protein
MPSPPNEPKVRKVIIPIRYPTPSREQIVIIVAQTQSSTGHWMVPLITFEGPLGPFLESGRFARDLGEAFIVAAYFYDQMMLYVKRDYLGEDAP